MNKVELSSKQADLSEEEDEAADKMGGTVYMKPTIENLKNMEIRQSQGFMGGSLVDRAMCDMQKANQVRSEINAQGGQLKAGSMFKSLEMAQRIGGMFMMNPLTAPTTPGAIVGDGRQSVESGSAVGGGAKSLRCSFIGTGLFRGVASHIGTFAKAKDCNKIQIT